MNVRIIYNLFATKYNYTNFKPHVSMLSISDNKLFYRSKNNKLKEMKGVIGIIYGTRTYTWRNEDIWKNYEVNSSLCLSAISPNRTYDFEFECLESLLTFLNLTRNITTTRTDISGGLIHRNYHEYTDEYITYYHNLFNACNFPNVNIWNAFLCRYKWDAEKNEPHIDNDIKSYKELSEPIKNLTTNQSCCICLDEWKDSDMCKILQCNHIIHNDCFLCFPSERIMKCPCCRAVIDNT